MSAQPEKSLAGKPAGADVATSGASARPGRSPNAPSGHSDSRAKEKLRARSTKRPHSARALRRAAHEAALAVRLKPRGRWMVASFAMLFTMAGLNLVRPLIMGDVIRQADHGDGHKLLRDGIVLSGLLIRGADVLVLCGST